MSYSIDAPEPASPSERVRDAARNLGGTVRSFYSPPAGWQLLIITSVLLTYVGGAVMFWLHAVYRGEQGPPISDVYHWLLDSTLGFVGLTPVVFVLLPLVARALSRRGVTAPWLHAAVVGAAFAVVTAPGPILHNAIAGAGTPVATAATAVLGHDPAVAARNLHAVQHSLLSEVLVQVAVGLPVYMGLAGLALVATKVVARTESLVTRTAPPALADITAVVTHLQPHGAVVDTADAAREDLELSA